MIGQQLKKKTEIHYPIFINAGAVLTSVLLFSLNDCQLFVKKMGWIVPLFFVMFFIMNVLLWVKTYLTDPGVISAGIDGDQVVEISRQQLPARSVEDPYVISLTPETHDHYVAINGKRVRKEYNWLHVDDRLIKLIYRETCQMYMPLRASHCKKCDLCIEKRDHHCDWIGCCVGRRNYKFFYFYLMSYIVLHAYIITFAIIHLVILSNQLGGFSNAAHKSPGTITELIISICTFCFVLYTFFYHNKIIAKGQTAIEEIVKFQLVDLFNRKSFWENLRDALCTSVSPVRM